MDTEELTTARFILGLRHRSCLPPCISLRQCGILFGAKSGATCLLCVCRFSAVVTVTTVLSGQFIRRDSERYRGTGGFLWRAYVLFSDGYINPCQANVPDPLQN